MMATHLICNRKVSGLSEVCNPGRRSDVGMLCSHLERRLLGADDLLLHQEHVQTLRNRHLQSTSRCIQNQISFSAAWLCSNHRKKCHPCSLAKGALDDVVRNIVRM